MLRPLSRLIAMVAAVDVYFDTTLLLCDKTQSKQISSRWAVLDPM